MYSYGKRCIHLNGIFERTAWPILMFNSAMERWECYLQKLHWHKWMNFSRYTSKMLTKLTCQTTWVKLYTLLAVTFLIKRNHASMLLNRMVVSFSKSFFLSLSYCRTNAFCWQHVVALVHVLSNQNRTNIDSNLNCHTILVDVLHDEYDYRYICCLCFHSC